METFDFVIPIGSKDIEKVVERETIYGVEILYTESGKSLAHHQTNTLDEVLEVEKLCNESFI